MTVDLNAYAARVHDANRKWWVSLETGERIERNLGEMEMLVITELAESLEGHRKNLMDDKLPHRRMAEVELADALIRELDIMGGFGWFVHPSSAWYSWGENFADNLLRITKSLCASDDIEPAARHSIVIHKIIALAERNLYDIWGAFEEKMLFNQTRIDHSTEHRRSEHGKKY